MTEEELLKRDMQAFLAMPDGVPQRIILRVIQMAGIFSVTTDGSKESHLAFAEGSRSLGFKFLDMVEAGQPMTHPSGQPLLSIYQALREEATKPREKPNDRRNRNDRYTDLDEPGDD